MADDVTTCGICAEPFKNGRTSSPSRPMGSTSVGPHMELSTKHAVSDVLEKFWPHPMCLFSIAREAEGPASTVVAVPPEPPDEGGRRCPKNVNRNRTFVVRTLYRLMPVIFVSRLGGPFGRKALGKAGTASFVVAPGIPLGRSAAPRWLW
jgi:hypothetical protein